MMHFKVLTVASWVAIASIVGLSALTVFWLLYPYPVSTIEQPIRILNKNNEVAIGSPIVQELKIHKPNNLPPSDASRVLVCEDGNLITLASLPNTLNLPTGEYTLINDRYVLPPKVSVGARCVFVWRQSYQVNPIRKIHVEWKSEPFVVIK